jgi:selenide,water dikinase
VLREILGYLPPQVDPNLLVGYQGADDAGVYRLDDERALVLTVDFFTPIVDDPYDYGRVAAANSLSDVYAMGAKPVVALNIAAFPDRGIPAEIFGDIFRGGADVAKEAGVVIAGGHTVKDTEIKYGLSVVGMVHPDRIVENAGARPGDRLILTKPLGTGILATAVKNEALDERRYQTLVASMTRLNRDAAEQMIACGVHACTDITGNGLLGHAFEMAEASGVTLEIAADDVPVLPGAIDMIQRNFLTAGGRSNRALVADCLTWARPFDQTLEHLLADPQTSGGLLISISPERCDELVERIRKADAAATVMGRAVAKQGDVLLRVV